MPDYAVTPANDINQATQLVAAEWRDVELSFEPGFIVVTRNSDDTSIAKRSWIRADLVARIDQIGEDKPKRAVSF